MKLLAVLILPLLTSFVSIQEPKPTPAKTAAPTEIEQELNETSKAYKEGRYADAQQHAERAVMLDPNNRTAAVFLARVMHQRYKPGDQTPGNLDFAQAAIAAYQRLLTLEPANDEAYKAVSVLYAATHQDEALKEWIMQRALDSRFSNEQRAEAYATLAGKDWDCSYKFTEQPAQKIRTVENRKAVITYKMPADRTEFTKAKECVNNGFAMVDLAFSLNRESEAAWSYNANLLLEAAKLAEMEGRAAAKASFQAKAKESGAEASRLSEKRRKTEAAAEAEPKPSPSPSPASLH